MSYIFLFLFFSEKKNSSTAQILREKMSTFKLLKTTLARGIGVGDHNLFLKCQKRCDALCIYKCLVAGQNRTFVIPKTRTLSFDISKENCSLHPNTPVIGSLIG